MLMANQATLSIYDEISIPDETNERWKSLSSSKLS